MAVPRGLVAKSLTMARAGVPTRRIAREIRVSRATCTIVVGKRSGPVPVAKSKDIVPEFAPRSVAPYWCAICERTVYLRPCVACAARKHRAGLA